MCKSWKKNGMSSRKNLDARGYDDYHFDKWSDFKRRYDAQEQIEEYELQDEMDYDYEWEETHQLAEEGMYWWFTNLPEEDWSEEYEEAKSVA